MLLATIAVAVMVVYCRADAVCETNCFTVEAGNYPTLVYNTNRAVRFEVRSFGSNGWFVVDASLRGTAYIADVPLGQNIYDHHFSYHTRAIDSSAINPPPIFRFAFSWEYTLESGTTLRHYGWASLITNAVGNVTVLACEVADVHGLPVVGHGEPEISTYETNCFHVVAGYLPHVAYNGDSSVDFAIDSYGTNGWRVVVHHPSGWGYVETGAVGEYVSNATFSRSRHAVEGAGDVFRFAFKWWREVSTGGYIYRYGWMTLGVVNGDLAILAGEISPDEDVVVVGHGEPELPIVPPGPDDIEKLSENPDDILLQWDFTVPHSPCNIFVVQGAFEHFIHGGDILDEVRTNFHGRSCVRLSDYTQCMTGWFSINEGSIYDLAIYENSYPATFKAVGDYYNPGLWDSVGAAFRLYSEAPCSAIQDPESELPIYGTAWEHYLYERSEALPDMTVTPGTVIHLDDKLWLRYFESEEGGVCTTNWQMCAGFVDASSNMVERIVALRAAGEGEELPSPVGGWTTVRIEAENAGTLRGLGIRIWIDGVAAASAMDGTTVFYARPSASDRNGVAALGIGGYAYIDDFTFFKKHRNPLDGVEVNTWYDHLSESEIKNLAAILGEEVIAGGTFIDAQTCDTPEDFDAAGNCIRLGILPKETEIKDRGGYGKELILKFKNPTVTITELDFAAGKITAKVVPAAGTRVTAPPMPYMFGLTAINNIGTEYMGTTEYGNAFSQGKEEFSVDLSSYMSSNGVFTLHFPEWVAPRDKSLFFKVVIKEYEHR